MVLGSDITMRHVPCVSTKLDARDIVYTRLGLESNIAQMKILQSFDLMMAILILISVVIMKIPSCFLIRDIVLV